MYNGHKGVVENMARVQIKVDDDLLKKIDAEAKEMGISRTAYINYVTANHIRNSGTARDLVANNENFQKILKAFQETQDK